IVQGTTLRLTLNLSGHQDMQFGAPDGNGIAPVVVPKSGVVFDPVTGVPGIQRACVRAEDDGVGIIDCDGGATNRDLLVKQDHNTTPANANNSGSAGGLPGGPASDGTPILFGGTTSSACLEGAACNRKGPHPGVCNSPVETTQSGTFGPGDIRYTQHVSITTLTSTSQYGPDGQPCTDDDTAPRGPIVDVLVITGTATGRIFDASNSRGTEIGPGQTCNFSGCITQVTGSPFDCDALRNAGSITGATLGTVFTGLDSQIGDVVTTLKLIAQ